MNAHNPDDLPNVPKRSETSESDSVKCSETSGRYVIPDGSEDPEPETGTAGKTDQSTPETTDLDHHFESIPIHAKPSGSISDKELPEGEEYPNALMGPQLRRMRRRMLRGIDLKTLRGVVTFGERVIHEAVKGNLSKKSADTLSRIAGRQAEAVGLLTEDEKLAALTAKLDAIEGRISGPALPEASGVPMLAPAPQTENPNPLIQGAGA